MTAKATFKTESYKFAHGRAPRGRGSWAFVPADYVYPAGTEIPEDGIVWAYGTFTEAKQEAARRYPTVPVWDVLT
jgi:hypothetical protein